MKIALICISPLRHDSRVQRHAALLKRAGHEVRIFAQSPLPNGGDMDIVELPAPGSDLRVRLGLVLRQLPATLWPATSRFLYWASWTRLRARTLLLRYRPDLVIANDWRALPLACAAQKVVDASVIYDSHEFASEEFSDSFIWRIVARRHVMWIEDHFIRRADIIFSVSKGISEALAARYHLPTTPAVIANMPQLSTVPFRPTGTEIEVLYHGVIAPRRGLEHLIQSVGAWPEAYRLVIRGESAGGFLNELRRLAAAYADRIRFEPAVAVAEVVKAASRSDIGIFLLENTTTHARFVLPNKIFEYLAAGLMIVSSDLPEIRRIIDDTQAGHLVGALTPAAISEIIGGLDQQTVDACKHNSLAAAQKLNFDREGLRLLQLVDGCRKDRLERFDEAAIAHEQSGSKRDYTSHSP